MPALGVAQETGKLLQWLKSEGQVVKKGEVLMVVETDKTTMEIEADKDGILSNVTASVGQDIPVGQVIALILAPGEVAVNVLPQPKLSKPESAIAQPNSSIQDRTPRVSPPAQGQSAIAASPLARRIAEENNIDLALVKASGEKIEKADVLTYMAMHPAGIEDQSHMAHATMRLAPASPKARVVARENSIDVTHIRGSGPDGSVVYADVMSAIAAKPAPTPQSKAVERSVAADAAIQPIGAETVKTGTIWRIMAERTTQSWTSVPHFYLSREVNAGRLMTWRERAQKRSSAKITYTDLIVRLVAAALQEHPRVNARWQDGAVHLNRDINIGLAVAIEDGLVVPVIHAAQSLSVSQIAARRAELVSAAQAGKLKPAEISGGTFTISNLGMYGVDSFNAIVNPPQAAILAIGRIVQRVVPVDDRPAVQHMMTMTLSCDHRAVDGARGAQFLQTLADMIEEPLGLLG